MAGGDGPARGARVVLFPLPFQGNLSPMLDLAGALQSAGSHRHRPPLGVQRAGPRAPPGARLRRRAGRHPGGRGRDDEWLRQAPRPERRHGGVGARPRRARVAPPCGGEGGAPTCVPHLCDVALCAAQKAAAGLGPPTLVLQTSSAACFRLFRSDTNDMLHDKGYLPATESNLHVPVKELPPLQVRYLFDPSKLPNKEIVHKTLSRFTEITTNSSGAILNTCEALESQELDMIWGELANKGIPPFVVGPLHLITSNDGAKTSLLQEDRSCIEWLDTQGPGSVLYVSFGSAVHVTQDEFMEIAWGIANSGKPFLWMVRRGLVLGVDKQELPDGFMSAVEGRGKVVEWAPQQEVLAHPAVGGFWIHNGWNSTLESIYEGVPMLSRPIFADQLPNARYVCDIWRTGILLEGVLERGEVEKAIKKLMEEDEGVRIRERAKDLKEKVRMCLESNGSSQQAVDKLVDHFLFESFIHYIIVMPTSYVSVE